MAASPRVPRILNRLSSVSRFLCRCGGRWKASKSARGTLPIPRKIERRATGSAGSYPRRDSSHARHRDALTKRGNSSRPVGYLRIGGKKIKLQVLRRRVLGRDESRVYPAVSTVSNVEEFLLLFQFQTPSPDELLYRVSRSPGSLN